MNTTTLSRHARSASFVQVPEWVKPAKPDVASFFSALCLAGLEGDGYFRLTAADQRALLGCVPFGQCSLKSDGSTIRVSRSVCFGTDAEISTYTGSELAAKIAAGECCRPGVSGKLST